MRQIKAEFGSSSSDDDSDEDNFVEQSESSRSSIGKIPIQQETAINSGEHNLNKNV